MARPLGITGQLGPRTTFEEHRARSRTSVLGVRQHFCWQMDVNAVFFARASEGFCPGAVTIASLRTTVMWPSSISDESLWVHARFWRSIQIHVRIISKNYNIWIWKMNYSRYDMWMYVACDDICTEHNYSNSLYFIVILCCGRRLF